MKTGERKSEVIMRYGNYSNRCAAAKPVLSQISPQGERVHRCGPRARAWTSDRAERRSGRDVDFGKVVRFPRKQSRVRSNCGTDAVENGFFVWLASVCCFLGSNYKTVEIMTRTRSR